MFIGKFATAIWLLRFSIPGVERLKSAARRTGSKLRVFRKLGHPSATLKQALTPPPEHVPAVSAEKLEESLKPETPPSQQGSSRSHEEMPVRGRLVPSKTPAPPRSLYPPAIMGMAMVARGEVAFLIASVADSQGIFKTESGDQSEIYTIVMWAALLCTIAGPIGVGMMVTRVKALEKESAERRGVEGRGGRDDVLGVWGDFTKRKQTQRNP